VFSVRVANKGLNVDAASTFTETGFKVIAFSVGWTELSGVAKRRLGEGMLTFENIKLEDQARELNAETLSAQREEKQGEGESDWLDYEESME
jgi:hypothetical protein